MRQGDADQLDFPLLSAYHVFRDSKHGRHFCFWPFSLALLQSARRSERPRAFTMNARAHFGMKRSAAGCHRFEVSAIEKAT